MGRMEIKGGLRMSGYFSDVTNYGNTTALIATMSFSEAKLRVAAENVANVHTPGFRARQLNTGLFQHALRRALDEKGSDPRKPLTIEAGRQVRTEANGMLSFRASVRPVDNALFHDGTNLSLEREMAELAETGMIHDLAASLLRGNFEGMRKAIRGTM